MLEKLRFSASCLLLQITPLTALNTENYKGIEPKQETVCPLARYLDILHDPHYDLGPFGHWKKGEIEINTEVGQIQKIEKQTKLRLMAKGIQEKTAKEWSTVGIIAEDNYLMWIPDAVIFPSGVYGTYDRIVWKSGMDGAPGAAVLPLLSTKKIVVNLNYRHATRGWE